MQFGYEVFCTGCGMEWQATGYVSESTCMCFQGLCSTRRWAYIKLSGYTSVVSVVPPMNYVMINRRGSVFLARDLDPLRPLRF